MKGLKDLEQFQLTVDEKKRVAYGYVSGLKYMITFQPQQRQYILMTTLKTENEMGALNQALEAMDKGEFINWVSYQEEAVIVNVKAHKALTASIMMDILNQVSSLIIQNGYVQCCRFCGEEKDVEVCSINGTLNLMCSECFSKVEITQEPVKKVNTPLGILGALVGSLIGIIAWVVIYKLGYIAGITGFIMAFGCFKGYQMLGGRMDKKGVWISLGISIVMLAVAEMISLGLEIYTVYGEYVSLSLIDAFRLLPYMLGEGEVLGAVVEDLLFGYVFMALASFTFVKNAYMSSSTDGVIEKLG